MAAAIRAGFVYFALVFALGVLLGSARTLWIEPRLGLASATLLELPVMLAGSWMVCGWVLKRFKVLHALRLRAVMGLTAFLLLMLAEFCVSALLMGRSLEEHLGTYLYPGRQWGLAAQLAFAVLPLLRRQAASAESNA